MSMKVFCSEKHPKYEILLLVAFELNTPLLNTFGLLTAFPFPLCLPKLIHYPQASQQLKYLYSSFFLTTPYILLTTKPCLLTF